MATIATRKQKNKSAVRRLPDSSATHRKNAASRGATVTARLDAEVDAFVRRTRFFREPFSRGRAQMFVLQHRQNTRQRNSVLKLRVATNCPDWDTRLRIIGACSEDMRSGCIHVVYLRRAQRRRGVGDHLVGRSGPRSEAGSPRLRCARRWYTTCI